MLTKLEWNKTFEWEKNERNWETEGIIIKQKRTHDDTKLRFEKLFTQLNAAEIQFFYGKRNREAGR